MPTTRHNHYHHIQAGRGPPLKGAHIMIMPYTVWLPRSDDTTFSYFNLNISTQSPTAKTGKTINAQKYPILNFPRNWALLVHALPPCKKLANL